jgi:hypothetical protein
MWGGSIGAARETVQHRFLTARIQLVHHARACRAAPVSGPIEVAFPIADHTGDTVTPHRHRP